MARRLDVQKWQDRVDALERERGDLDDKQQEQDALVDQLEGEIADAEETKRRCMKELESLTTKRLRLSEKVARLEEKLEEARQTLTRAEEQEQASEGDVSATRGTRKAAKKATKKATKKVVRRRRS